MIQIQKTLSEKYMSDGLDKMASDVIEILKWIAHSNNSCWADNNGAAKAIDTIRQKSEDIVKLNTIMRCFGYYEYRTGMRTTYHVMSTNWDQFRQLPSLNGTFGDKFVHETVAGSFSDIRCDSNCANRARRILKSLHKYFSSVDGDDYSDLERMASRHQYKFAESPR